MKTHDPYGLLKATDRFPSPRRITIEVLSLIEKESTAVEDIVAVIQSDPALSLQVLKLANHPLMGLDQKVSSLSRAVVYLGFRTMANLVLSLSLVQNNQNNACAGFDDDTFWSESLARAVVACQLAKITKMFPSDEAFVCAMLCQVGRLALVTTNLQRHTQASVHGRDHGRCDPDFEVVAMDRNVLTSKMMAAWHLPVIFVQAVRVQANPEAGEPEVHPRVRDFARLLYLSGSIARVFMTPSDHSRVPSVPIERDAFGMGISRDVLCSVIESAWRLWPEVAGIFAVPVCGPAVTSGFNTSQTKRRHETVGKDPGRVQTTKKITRSIGNDAEQPILPSQPTTPMPSLVREHP